MTSSQLPPSELKLCGLPAVLARWRKDPSSLLRLFFDQRTGQRLGTICSELAAAKKVYRCVQAEELAKIAGSNHHGGVVAVVAHRGDPVPSPADYAAWAASNAPLLILDRIGNPHNLGALARTAAFLGVRQVIVPDDPAASRSNEAAYRVSEGGLDAVTLWVVPSLPECIAELRMAGYFVLGAATRDGRLLRPGAKARPVPADTPTALVLGNEEQGMAPKVAAACSRLVTLAGNDSVESLNVSVAGALLMWECLASRPAQQAPKRRGPSRVRIPKAD